MRTFSASLVVALCVLVLTLHHRLQHHQYAAHAAVQSLCASEPSPATFIVSTYDKTTDSYAVTERFAMMFGIGDSAFTVARSNNNPANNTQSHPEAGYCPGSGAAETCYNFSMVISSDNEIATSSKNNRANYTRVGLEAMLSLLFRNSSSAKDDPHTLNALNLDSVTVVTPSCATTNAATILSKGSSAVLVSPAPKPQAPNACPPSFSIKNTASSSSADNKFGCSDPAQQAAIAASLSTATGGAMFTYRAQPQEFLPPQTCCCFDAPYSENNNSTALGSIFANAIRQDSQPVVSSIVDALVPRSMSSMISPAFSLSIGDVPFNANGGVVAGCSPSSAVWGNNTPQQRGGGGAAASSSTLAFIVQFACSGAQNNASSSISAQWQDAVNVSTALTMTFPSVFSLSPLVVPTSSGPRMLVNFSSPPPPPPLDNTNSSGQRVCGILLFITPQANITQLSQCSRQWSNRTTGDYVFVNNKIKKPPTPPLMLISLVVTAVLYFVVMAYIYKFKPTSRRFDFPPQGLSEAMLDNEQEMLAEATRDVVTTAVRDSHDTGEHHHHGNQYARFTPKIASETVDVEREAESQRISQM